MKRKQKKNRKKIINIIIRSVIICILIIIVIDENKERSTIRKKKIENNYNIQDTQRLYESVNGINKEAENINLNNTKINLYDNTEIIDTYKGYDVVAKLEIPKINLETYVLGEFSVDILNVSVTKFWGASPNEIGNCCIAGHNFRRKNMFHNLKKLKIGDKCFISDNEFGKIEYEIYDIYTVSPQNVNCLSQDTNNREVTLITCTNDSKNRIIVKAKEVVIG